MQTRRWLLLILINLNTMNKYNRFAFLLLGFSLLASFKMPVKPDFFPTLNTYIQSLSLGFKEIPADRILELEEIANFIIEQKKAQLPANLVFVCTSNSRRSHMAQVWAQVAANHYQIDNVFTFSGGTEQTRVNINAIDALSRAGIELSSNKQGDNPLWYVRTGNQMNPWVIFSKKHTDSTNPNKNFAAIMVCAEADKACPTVEGALLRIGLPYADPKAFDNTNEKASKYDERCKQIATEMFFVFEQVSKKYHGSK